MLQMGGSGRQPARGDQRRRRPPSCPWSIASGFIILPEAIARIIFRICSNCLVSCLTAWTFVPDPAAIRRRREPRITSGLARSSGVTERIIASTAAVPDVTTQDFAIAQATLEAAGFRSRVVFEDTPEPSFDGIVISQDPVGGSQAKPDSLVTLFVGRFTGETTTEP